jgi:sugar O-acyltransferase (sialic acid O-acetyltransferase NeuD family)
MSRPQLLLVGAGGHARACIDVIERSGSYEIAGLLGFPNQVGGINLGYPIISDDSDLFSLADKYRFALVTVGQVQLADVRARLYQQLLEAGFVLPTIISPLAQVSPHASIEAGTIIMHASVINAGAVVGRNCIVNTRALVEHDAVVGNHSHLATGAILNGGARIGSYTHVGSGTVVKEGVSIGNGCLVGMGLSVRHDIADGVKFVGGTKL